MGLLSDVREILQRVQDGRMHVLAEKSGIDLNSSREFLLRALATDTAWTRERHQLLAHWEALCFELAQQIADEGVPPSELSAALPGALAVVLRWRYGLDVDVLGAVELAGPRATLRDWSCEEAGRIFAERVARGLPSPRRYALELGLVHVVSDRPRLRPAGEVYLRLSGVDAVRWIVALELLTSLDRDDPWRGHSSLASELLKRRKLEAYHFEFQYGPDWPWDNPALRRWTDMGLLQREEWERAPDEPDGGESYTLTELGAGLLAELLGEPDVPLKSLARALIEDSSAIITDAAPVRHGTSGASVVRHARMIAHELRNALVPVRLAYDRLWAALPRDDVRVSVHRYHERILAGLDRAFQFVTDAARAVSPAADETGLFGVASALRDACDSMRDDVAVDLRIEPEAEMVRIRGARQRLLLALIEILRNALKSGGPSVRVAATLSRVEGHVAVIVVDDSGPGVPSDHSDQIFENGHTKHEHGSGHGLALVREVVEEEFTGSVHHEASPLGGARFVLRIPIPSEAI